ncbi:glycosyltransferase family 4 protein [Clostridium gasigenes]|uniref:glycosyltransferase family 4 protein n=1 Tax=Clostridium gasigenes TaxID=94869 RepID=UPI0016283E10|nr:glycosyltransferase family 4 protein [Clostridium gasigenes]MBB6624656.1 glycosyltransferase family 4 protein [Clostridium gasigenes]
MKRILYITTVSRTINAFLIPHIEMLLENGYKVDCACAVDKELDSRLLDKGVQIYNIPFCRNPLSIGNLKAFKKLIQIQKENKYDIVHTHTPVASIYGRLLKVKFRKLKIIYTAHGYHFFKGGSKIGWLLYYPIEKIMAKLTDVIININAEDYEITRTKLKPKKSCLVKGVGLDKNDYKKLSQEKIKEKKIAMGYKAEDFIVIMIAELNENKNQIQLLKAIELLKDKYSNIKALFVGEGDKLEELKVEAERRGIEKKIKFLGFRRDVNNLINISDIGVLLSYREGLPRNIMELMLNGKKVIATDIRGCRDLVENDNVGNLVGVGDYEATAKAIERYYLSVDNINKVPEEIKAYDVKVIQAELEEIYKTI